MHGAPRYEEMQESLESLKCFQQGTGLWFPNREELGFLKIGKTEGLSKQRKGISLQQKAERERGRRGDRRGANKISD
jgi:hypothetical protein